MCKGDPKTENCVEKHKKLQYCIKIYENSATVDANVLDNVINTSGSPFHYKYNPFLFLGENSFWLQFNETSFTF